MTAEEREARILQWLPLAWQGCRRFRNVNIMTDDLRQEAVVGLILAVDKFDFDGGRSFSPYAASTINRHLRAVCGDQMRVYRIPYWLNNLATKVSRGKVLRADLSPRGQYYMQFLDGHRIPESHIAYNSWDVPYEIPETPVPAEY